VKRRWTPIQEPSPTRSAQRCSLFMLACDIPQSTLYYWLIYCIRQYWHNPPFLLDILERTFLNFQISRHMCFPRGRHCDAGQATY